MASGDSLLLLTPHSNEPPSSNAATLDTRNQHLVLDFDASTQEGAVFTGVMPQHYAGGSINVVLHYAMSSATAGSVAWDVSFERIGDGQQDLDSDGFASAQSGGETVPGTSGNVSTLTIAFTQAQADSVAAGEAFRLKVERDADGTNNTDDASGDAEIVAVELQEE